MNTKNFGNGYVGIKINSISEINEIQCSKRAIFYLERV